MTPSTTPTPIGDLSRSSVTPAGKIVVGVADMAIAKGPSKSIITYALGSCIAVTLYDPVTKVGGMLHFMLAESSASPEKAKQNPALFADTGVPLLFHRAYALGANKARLILCAAGGAEILVDDGHFRIGARNRTMLRRLFWNNNVLLTADDTGGNYSRTLTLSLEDGSISVRAQGKDTVLWAPAA